MGPGRGASGEERERMEKEKTLLPLGPGAFRMLR